MNTNQYQATSVFRLFRASVSAVEHCVNKAPLALIEIYFRPLRDPASCSVDSVIIFNFVVATRQSGVVVQFFSVGKF